MSKYIYDEKYKQVYLKLIKSGVTKYLLTPKEEFVFEKKLGYQEDSELTVSKISQLYYEAGHSKNVLASSRISQIFYEAVFKVEYMLKKYSIEQLIQYFSINSLEYRKEYIKTLYYNSSLKEIPIIFLNLSIRIEHKLNKSGFSNLNDLVNAESYDIKKVLNNTEFEELKTKLKELDLNLKGASLLEKSIEELTDDEKQSINISDLFRSNTINALHKNGIYTIRDILKLSYSKLYTLSFLTKSSINEIMEKLNSFGYKLVGEEEFIYLGKTKFSFDRNIKKLTETEKRNLSVRAIYTTGISRILMIYSINTIDELLKLSCKELIEMKGLGIVSIRQIIKKLNDLGFHLYDEENYLENNNDNIELESDESLNEIILSQEAIIKDKNNLLLEYRKLLEEYKKVKTEEEILNYQIDYVRNELNKLKNGGKKYEKKD